MKAQVSRNAVLKRSQIITVKIVTKKSIGMQFHFP